MLVDVLSAAWLRANILVAPVSCPLDALKVHLGNTLLNSNMYGCIIRRWWYHISTYSFWHRVVCSFAASSI